MMLRSTLAVMAIVVISACGIGGEQLPAYRYRATVEVKTPEGLRIGSSVIEVRTRRFGKEALPQARGYKTDVEGEAIVVDLGKRGTLFAVLTGRETEAWPSSVIYSVLPRSLLTASQRERFAAVLALSGEHQVSPYKGPAGRELENYPALVHFRDPKRPETATIVAPDKLAEVFGAGVSLNRITVARTEAPITRGIRSQLPWLREEPTGTIDETFSGSSSASAVGLGKMHFERSF